MASSIGRWLGSLRQRLVPAEPEQLAAIREQLKWFNRFEGPPPELVDWFSRVHAEVEGEGAPQVLTVAAALERRKWILRGTPENPDDQHFDGRSNWLPLIAWDRNLLIYESGPARSGLVLRSVDRREQYVKDRAHPMPLPTFEVRQLTAPVSEEEEEDEGVDPLERLAQILDLKPRVGEWMPGEQLPFFTGGVPGEVMDWFRLHDGQAADEAFFQKAAIGARWRVLGLDEAVVFRDLMIERATPELGAFLQREPGWVPLFAVGERDLVVYAEDRGIAFFARRADRFDAVAWSRWIPFGQFLAAALAIVDPEPAEKVFAGDVVDDWPYRVVAEVQAVTGALDEPLVQREAGADVLPEDLGVSPNVSQELPAWFEANVRRPGPPLVANGELALTGREALAIRERRVDFARQWLPLVAGADGALTSWVEGVGIAEVHADGSMVPLAETFLSWLEGLLNAAHAEVDARRQPGSIARSPTGVWTVDVAPMTAGDVAAALRSLPWSFTRGSYTLTIERAPELYVRAEAYSRLVLGVTDAVVERMIADLEALEGFEPMTLHWEDLHDLVLIARARA